ncbi:hypothetical protein [Kibdelosporangium phytohabitans]|uniref:Uncharacterized protein n=1 Tax=Kibdelosporangium phytohabitans TaxID=860235 RepID=A0A0N9I3V6_9PSEU|nr:hypothetical protein [Kibdelosporangium phytohabitans]ALG12547.1 hypothetical protein AOZ06_41890 [Kibdelosporangium phytohabitans]MBE1464160.1 hypothetical protein [Kibdelosporangium phytohabitans]
METRARLKEAATLSAVLCFIYLTAIFFTATGGDIDYLYAWISGPAAMVIGLGLILRCRPGR